MRFWPILLWLHYDITLTLIGYIVIILKKNCGIYIKYVLKINYSQLYYNRDKNNIFIIIVETEIISNMCLK